MLHLILFIIIPAIVLIFARLDTVGLSIIVLMTMWGCGVLLLHLLKIFGVLVTVKIKLYVIAVHVCTVILWLNIVAFVALEAFWIAKSILHQISNAEAGGCIAITAAIAFCVGSINAMVSEGSRSAIDDLEF